MNEDGVVVWQILDCEQEYVEVLTQTSMYQKEIFLNKLLSTVDMCPYCGHVHLLYK